MSTIISNSSSFNSKVPSVFSKDVQQVNYALLWAYVSLLEKEQKEGETSHGLEIFIKKLLKVLTYT